MFKKIRESYEVQLFIICILVSAFHLWQFFDSGFNINCIVRCIAIFVCGITCIIIRHNVFYIGAYITSLGIMHFDMFNNYSSFFFAYILCRKYPKFKLWILLIYAVNIFVVCELHGRYATHLFIHFIMCTAYFILAENSDKKVVLMLTEDETTILHQLENENKTVDCVDGYSKSTVLRRLDEACIRNNLDIKEHTKLRFMFRTM